MSKGKQMSTSISDIVDFINGLEETHSPHCDEPDDESLIYALSNGAVWAMDLLYDRYSGLLYSLACRMVEDRQIAEDLLQDVLLSIWRHVTSYTPQSGTVRSWLMSIMRHRAIDYLRGAHRRGATKAITWKEDGWEDATPDVWDEVWHSVQSALVRECLAKLLYEQRVVIELAYFQGWTQVEIAKGYQIPLGTVKARMRLGLHHLKRELEKRGIVGT